MIRTLSIWTAPLVWALCATTLLAQSNPLELIPDTALGFAVIKDLSDANQRVAKVTEKMQLPVPDLLTLARTFLGIQDGLDEKGGLAVALMSGGEGRAWEDSAFFALVPVTDYQKFIAPFEPADADAAVTRVTMAGMDMVAGKKGSFAVLAFGEKQQALEKFLAATNNVAASVEPLKEWMADKQLAVVVTPSGKKLLFQTIAAALPDAEQLQKVGGAGALKEQTDALGNVGEMFGMFKQLLIAADEQLTHLAAGIRIEDNAAVHVAVRALFVPGGKLAVWSKDIKVPEEGLLAGVPEGKFAIAYGGVSAHFSPETWAIISRFGEMGMQVIGLDDESRKKYQQIMQKVQAGKLSSGGVMGMMRPGDSLFSTALAVEHVKNADEHFQGMRQMFELMQTAQKNPQANEPLYELHDVKVGKLEALEFVTRVGSLTALAGANNPGAEQARGLFDKMFGGDGTMHLYVAKADEHTVVTAYGKEQLLHGVEHVRSGAKGLESNADLAKTTAMLPSGAQWVAYVSPQGLIQWISVFVEAIMGGEIHLPAFAATEPIGLAARVSETGLDAELVLPEGVVAGIGQYIGLLAQMFQGGGVPLP
jgi:hypothetical protein